MSRAPASSILPTAPEELTPEWLTAALRSRGHLGASRVSGYSTEPLGEGEGFVGQIVRLHLRFDRPDPGFPSTLIAKFPIRIAQNRRLGQALGAYEREIQFYEQLAARVPIRTPACYYAAMDPNPLEGREQEGLAWAERTPRWLIPVVVPLLLWSAARSRRRYLLLLEDIDGEVRLGDQVAGADPPDIERALRTIAAVHARFWAGGELDRLSWVVPANALAAYAAAFYRHSRATFFAGMGAGLPPRMSELGDWFVSHGEPLMRSLSSMPQTLVHGDYRLDNLFFPRAEGDGVIAFDWQSVARGPGVLDVAYFISGSLRSEQAPEHELDLLRSWHEAIGAHGVADYPFEQCLADYQRCKLFIAYRTFTGADLIDFSDERGTRLIHGWLKRLAALVPDDFERWLGGGEPAPASPPR